MTKHISTWMDTTAPAGGAAANLTDDYLRWIQEAVLADLNGFPGNIWIYGTDATTADDVYDFDGSPTIDGYATGMQVILNLTGGNANSTTTPTLEIEALGAKTIKRLDGSALAVGDLVAGLNHLIYDGTDFLLVNSSAIDFVTDKEYTFTARQNWGKGTATAAANDLTLPTDGNYVALTAAAPVDVNGINDDIPAGSIIFLELAADITLKHNTAASANFDSLTLPGGEDFVSEAGDLAMLVSHGAGNNFTARCWRLGQRSDLIDEDNLSSDSDTQAPTQGNVKAYVDALPQWALLTSTTTTAGSEVEVVNISATATQLKVVFDGIGFTTNGKVLYLEFGSTTYSGAGATGGCSYHNIGVGTYGYKFQNGQARVGSASNSTSDFIYGHADLIKHDDDTFSIQGCSGANDGDTTTFGGAIALGGTLDRLKIVTDGTFDAGMLHVWEFA